MDAGGDSPHRPPLFPSLSYNIKRPTLETSSLVVCVGEVVDDDEKAGHEESTWNL